MKSDFQWEDGFDRNFLLSKIADCRTISGGKCSFKAMDYAFWLPVLNSAIRDSKLVGSLKSLCVKGAIADPTVKLNDPQKFLERCRRAFDDIGKRKKQKYIMVCYITYTGPKLFNRIADGNCRVCWQPKYNNRIFAKALAARNSLANILSTKGVSTHSDGLTALLVHVDAHSFEHAHEQATNIVDRLRGILNLMVNSNRLINPFSRLAKPHAVNRFRIGPYRTIHHPDGSLATQMFWYEPRWAHDQESVKFAETAESTKTNIMKWWKRTQSNALRDNIADGLLRYCRALDQHDTDAALLGLWSALENLTGTQKEKYDVTVSRIAKLFKDHPDARQIALHVKLRRNSTIHAARSPANDEVDAVILQAEMLVSQIIFFYIKNGKFFRSQQELIDFLDLSMNQQALIRRKEIIDHFIEYQKR